jgi:phosphoglycolate phosphatase
MNGKQVCTATLIHFVFRLRCLLKVVDYLRETKKQFYDDNRIFHSNKRSWLEQMIRAVIFDLDGTLTEFNLDIKACRTEVINFLTKQGFPRHLFSLKESAFDMLVKMKSHRIAKGMEKQEFEKLKKEVFSIVEGFELKAARTTKIFAGIPETLQALRDMKLKIALCTISSEEATGFLLKRFHLRQFFDAILTRESVAGVKPHPAHLEAVLDALKVRPHEAMLVGDSVKDMACAKKLDVLAVGVATGISSIEDLSQSGAHYLASSANDVPILIQQLDRKKLDHPKDGQATQRATIHYDNPKTYQERKNNPSI